MTPRSAWLLSVLALAALFIGIALSHRLAPGVRVESVTLAGGTPALRFLPPREGPHPVALLLHGVTASKETLFRVGEALAADGFVGYAIDLPGHGESPRPFDPDGNAREIAQVAQAIGPIDVVVGHSMGAYAGAASVRHGHLRPRIFIALGALPELPEGDPPLLILAGAFEEAVPSALLHARRDARLVVSPWSDHALEPYDPRLVDAVVESACQAVGSATSRAPAPWLQRLVGFALAVSSALGLALVAPNLSPRLARWRAPLTALLVIAAIAASAGTWLGAAPIARRAPEQLVAIAGSSIILVFAGKYGLPRWAPAAIGVAIALILGLAGAPFLMLLAALATLVLAAGALIGAVAARNGARRDGDLAMAIFIGYAVGQWLPHVL